MSATSNTLRHHLGKNGPSINPLGLGCMGMSAFYGKADSKGSIDTLNKAIELGCTFWDSADVYGQNEELLGQYFKDTGNRDKVFLCTKFGFDIHDKKDGKPNGKPEYIKTACASSLKRLGVDHIDLYYMHRMDPNTPIEDTMKALAELVKQGKIKHIGLSECSAETLRRAHAVHPIAAVQVEYSPWTLDIETNGLLAACKELGVAIVAYSPLGRGFLTGRFKSEEDLDKDDWRRKNPRFQGENFKKNLKLVEKIEEIAQRKNVKASQLVLAWVLEQGDNFFTIPGTTRAANLEENMASLNVKVTKEDDAAIRAITKEIGVAGTRYDEAGLKTLNL
ncbi:putative oxidoreductase [Fimicolochytrium jonesii]|uniref:putative oxidoreductase n=1 Tax=Fimicolochytrium jonesii TaxID=1396493 RepID=UPI0022FF38E0|nr:putative oxidoreductase [Fimicolochytrium jonesii]KAI8824128.1 putative oxidoreductase [Fimicolochytrium jonesii]